MPGASMWIPWSDFKGILEKLSAPRPPAPDPPPPVDAVVSGADYEAVVGEEGVAVTMTVKILVLEREEWVSVPVMRAGIPLLGAEVDGEPTASLTEKDGTLQLVVRGAGEHTLTLRLSLALTETGGPAQFTLHAVRSPVNRIEVRIGRPDLEVAIAPKSGHLESRTTGDSTVAVGSFPPTDRVTLSWTRNVAPSVRETSRVSAEARTMLTVGDGLGVYTTIIDYDIRHRPVSRFALSLPASVTVADVSTEGLVDWAVEETGEDQTLTVSTSYEVIGRHQLAVTYEAALPSGTTVTFGTADLILEDVVHEVGYLAVAVRSNVQVDPKEGSLRNLAKIDPGELPPDLRGSGDQKVLYAFKYLKHPSGVELNVIKHKDASVLTCEVRQADYRVLLTDRGKQLIEGTYRIANRTLQYLTLTLPEGTDLWGVYREGEPIKAAEADGKILLPIFRGGPHGTFTMKIVAYRKTPPLSIFGTREIELPTLDVGVNRLDLALYTPSRFRLLGFGGTLLPTRRRPAGSSSAALSGESTTVSDLASKGLIHDLRGLDKEAFDRNVRYREEQSQVHKQILDIPVEASNLNYRSAMARGALPVELDITWEGGHRTFGTRIVDPEEKASITFYYGLRKRSSILKLLLFLFAAYPAYFLAHFLLSRSSSFIEAPAKSGVGLALVSLLLMGAAATVQGGGRGTIVLGFVLGAGIMLLRWTRARRRDRSQPMPPPGEGPSEGGAS